MKRLICVLALIPMLFLAGCAAKTEKEPAPELMEPVGVRTDSAEAVRGDIYSITVSEGSVKAGSEELSFEIDGKISVLNCYPGKRVTAGEELFELDQTSLEKRITQLERQLERTEADGAYDDAAAEIDIEIMGIELEEMRAAGAGEQELELKALDISQAELDLKQAKELRAITVRSIETDLNALKADIGRNTITAPFDGHVFYLDDLKPGTWVRAGKTVAYIVNPADMTVVVDSYLQEYQIAKAHAVWAIIGDGRYGVEYKPMAKEEMTSIILSGHSLFTRFTLTGTEEELKNVSPGMYAALCVENLLAEDALYVPAGALYVAAGERYVYVETEEGRRRRVVTTGKSNGLVTEITSGLEEGEQVYVKE